MRARIYALEPAPKPRTPTTFAQTPTSQRKNKRNNIISRTRPVKLTFTNPYIYRHAPQEQKKSLFNLRQRVTFVLRAGVEPAQVSLSVFETDASTDSAIEANWQH